MLKFSLIVLPLALGQAVPVVDGSRMVAGSTCYALTKDDQPIGAALQTVAATTANGAPAWDIVIHQRVPGFKFDMRDHFVLRASDLTPILLDSRKDGTEHVRVAYASGKAVTSRPGKPDVTITFDGKIWDGNLWGLTFAAMPLAQGARFELPFYQYDKGLGKFTVEVVGSDKVGDQDAWIVEAGADPQRKTRYLIGKTSHGELGAAASRSNQVQ
jgi:hypothetical protein